jgi:ribosomal protein S18 acetylase RimI-like enzyme
MNLSYRKGTKDDLNAIDILVSDAIGQMESQGIMQWDEIYPAHEVFERDIKAGNLYIGCDAENMEVVYVLNHEFDEAYKNGKWQDESKSFHIIHRLCVNPKYQHQGIARMTMEHIEEVTRQHGIEAIRLDVFTENPYALRLYDGCGYRTVGKVRWRKGAFYLMEKYL